MAWRIGQRRSLLLEAFPTILGIVVAVFIAGTILDRSLKDVEAAEGQVGGKWEECSSRLALDFIRLHALCLISVLLSMFLCYVILNELH
jgi:hypothetical protein